jgi:MSHA pilin protein MshA
VSFGGDARGATMNAAKGAMLATASMVKGKYVVEGGRNPTVTVEDQTVTYVVGNGYPTATAAFLAAAGLGSTSDYTVIPPSSTATLNAPATTASQIAVIPAGVSGTTAGLNCFARYTAPAASTTAPGTAETSVTSC